MGDELYQMAKSVFRRGAISYNRSRMMGTPSKGVTSQKESAYKVLRTLNMGSPEYDFFYEIFMDAEQELESEKKIDELYLEEKTFF